MSATHVISVLWTVFFLVWLFTSIWTKRTQERIPFSSRLLYGIPVFIGSYLMFRENLPFGWIESRLIPKNIFMEVTAVSLTAAGIAFAIWARFYLGQNWSSAVSIKVGHQLIRTGPIAGCVTQFIPGYCWLWSVLHWHASSPLACSQLLYFGWASG